MEKIVLICSVFLIILLFDPGKSSVVRNKECAKKRGNLYTNAVHHIRNRWRLLNNKEISSQILAEWVLTVTIRLFTFHEARDNSLLTQKSKEGKLNRLRANWLIFTFSLPTRPHLGFPGGSDGKASVYSAGDPGLIPGLGRSAGEGNGNLLQYNYLENPMDRGAW